MTAFQIVLTLAILAIIYFAIRGYLNSKNLPVVNTERNMADIADPVLVPVVTPESNETVVPDTGVDAGAAAIMQPAVVQVTLSNGQIRWRYTSGPLQGKFAPAPNN